MRKHSAVLALALCLFFAFGTVAVASPPAEIVPNWNSDAAVTPVLSISGSIAKCKLFVNTQKSSENIVSTVYLQKKQSNGAYGNPIKTWRRMTGVGSLAFTDTYTPVSGGSYRLKAMVYIYGAGGTEEIVEYVYGMK